MKMTGEQILDIEMDDYDSGATTIRGYFQALLYNLIAEEEGFSGKRPFGNSGWKHDLAKALVVGGAVKGTIERYEEDEDEYIEVSEFEWKHVNIALQKAIAAL